MWLDRVKSWPLRVLLLYLILEIYWVTYMIDRLHIGKHFSTLYFKLECYGTILLLAFIISGSDALLSPWRYNRLDEDPKVSHNVDSTAALVAATKACILLTVFFPLYVTSHWIYCSRITSWHNWAIIFTYCIICVAAVYHSFSDTRLSRWIGWKHFIGIIALFHIYPSWVAGNMWAVFACLFLVLSLFFWINSFDMPEYWQVIPYLCLNVVASICIICSIKKMIPPQLTRHSSVSEWGSWLLSWTQVVPYVAMENDYKCRTPYFNDMYKKLSS